MTNKETCAERVGTALASRIEDIEAMYEAEFNADPDDEVAEQFLYENGRLSEYGLCFDYVEPFTFGDDQVNGYWRWQISYGGPSEEFRVYTLDRWGNPWESYFVFLDWYDGAKRKLTAEQNSILREAWSVLGFAELAQP